ncbi:MAG: hypothetical protein R2715_06125 [Ilumatobacteraceae bacterium]
MLRSGCDDGVDDLSFATGPGERCPFEEPDDGRPISATSHDGHANTLISMLALSTATTTWLLSVLAALLGSVATYLLSRSGDRRRLAAEDQRRWLNDRRTLYSRYLGLVEGLERDADSIACFLPHDDDAPPMTAEDERLVREMSHDWIERWDTELQPMLSEMELLATPDVADLAVRAAHGILAAVPQSQYLGPEQSKVTPNAYSDHWPTQQMAKGLRELLRNAMRVELGLELVSSQTPSDRDWPWLPEQPSFEDHRKRMGPYLWPHVHGETDEGDRPVD